MNRINVKPTFLLRKVDFSEIITKYHRGTYTTVTLPESDDKTKNAISKGLSSKPIQAMFNPLLLGPQILTSGDRMFVDSQNLELKEGKYVCGWDRQYFVGTPWGIPIKHEVSGGKEIYQFDGCYCSPQCAYAELRKHNNLVFAHRDPLYVNSEQILHQICYLCNPNVVLCEANDYRLIRENGGSMSLDDFRRHNTLYRRTSNIISHFVRFEYLRH